MAQFQSTMRRNYWFQVLYGTVFDYAVLFVGAMFFTETKTQAAVAAAALLVGIWLFQTAYALVGAAKGALLFFTFDKKQGVQATVDQMVAAKMPRPMELYIDAEEYLAEVVRKPEAGADAKLLAGSLIGYLRGTQGNATRLPLSHPVNGAGRSDQALRQEDRLRL
jgi:hypothetical protein